jgi:hypothetical protein
VQALNIYPSVDVPARMCSLRSVDRLPRLDAIDESKDGHQDYTPRSDATFNACGYYGRLQDFEREEEAEMIKATG